MLPDAPQPDLGSRQLDWPIVVLPPNLPNAEQCSGANQGKRKRESKQLQSTYDRGIQGNYSHVSEADTEQYQNCRQPEQKVIILA
jgi:hypothetical protein